MSEIITDAPLPVPAPAPNPDTAKFWTAAAEGRFVIKRCEACGEAHWYPRPICPFCHSDRTVCETGSGRGTVYSFTVIRRAYGPWREAAPYLVAYVTLEEGPTIMTNIVDCEVDDIRIDDPVEVVFHAGDGHVVPRFRPARTR